MQLDEKDAPEQAIVIAAVWRWLETHDRWLLIYDNAEDPKVVRETLPRVPSGHVLITSRNPAWGDIAGTVPLNRWHRAESIRFLKERRQEGEDRAADRVAEALGDLPLALEQTAAYCEQTGTALTAYADLLEQGYSSELTAARQQLCQALGQAPTGFGMEAVMPGEVEQRAVVNNAAFRCFANYGGLHPVSEDFLRHTTEVG